MSRAEPSRHDTRAALLRDASSELERILRGQLEGHQRLLACMERKRQAIREANIDVVNKVCAEESAWANALAELDKRRHMAIAQLTRAIDPASRAPLPISALAPHLEQATGARLLALAAQLRDVLDQVQRTSSIIRTAADALSRHMSGIVQSVQMAMSRSRLYSPRGRVETCSQLRFSVDLKS